MFIREASVEDWDGIWSIFKEVVTLGDTYAYDQQTREEDAKQLWLNSPQKTFVLIEGGSVKGTYYIKANQVGQGNHVCNCGYMVSSRSRGKGFATSMCLHSQKVAVTLGYKAMQFNFVASSNKGAISLWEKLGFETVGRLPKSFNHPQMGYIDALVMYKWL